jgi:N6-adenosine-specific RNA methylase IME4
MKTSDCNQDAPAQFAASGGSGARSKFKTIVADPPWRYKRALPGFPGDRENLSGTPYNTMSIEEICALPVRDLAEDDAHLYMWTTGTHLFESAKVVEAWGFRVAQVLTWCKPPRGITVGAFSPTTEFAFFCRRGSLPAARRIDSTWFLWKRSGHSAKPEAFIDMVESVSPGPYVELFARRQRLGWATWGNEALNHVELVLPNVRISDGGHET